MEAYCETTQRLYKNRINHLKGVLNVSSSSNDFLLDVDKVCQVVDNCYTNLNTRRSIYITLKTISHLEKLGGGVEEHYYQKIRTNR